MNNYNLTAKSAIKIFYGLLLLEISFVAIYALNIFIASSEIKLLFDLDSEGSLSAWFSSTQLFIIGMVFLLKSQSIAGNHTPPPYFFITLSLGFIFLSADEAAAIHEKMSVILKQIDFLPRFKDNHGVWISVYAVVFFIILITYFRSVLAMHKFYKRETAVLALGIATFMCGGLLLEIISYQFLRSGATPTAYAIEVMAEEFLEMSGASIMLYGAFLMLLRNPGDTHSN